MESLGKYTIVEEIGRGGMGAVYRAHDPVIGRDVAIKIILERAVNAPEAKERFYREARSAGRLSHENVMVIHDVGEQDGHPYIVMEYLPGTDLRVLLRDRAPLTLDEQLAIALQICAGLRYAHERNVIHRDVKPENIRILPGNRVKILDFGIAHLASETKTLTHASIGTPRYMSPEQIKGQKVDHRADIFSFGVLFYELLTGVNPFDGEHITTVIYKILNVVPEPVRVDDAGLEPDLRRIVTRCMAKDREDRYPDLGEVIDDLRDVIARRQATLTGARPALVAASSTAGGRGAAGRPPAADASGKRASGRPRRLVLAGAALAAAVLVGIVAVMAGGEGASTAERAVLVDSGQGPAEALDPEVERRAASDERTAMLDQKARAEAAAPTGEPAALFEDARAAEAAGEAALAEATPEAYRAARDAFAEAASRYGDVVATVEQGAEALRAEAAAAERAMQTARRSVPSNDAFVDRAALRRADAARVEGDEHLQASDYTAATRAYETAAARYGAVRQAAVRAQQEAQAASAEPPAEPRTAEAAPPVEPDAPARRDAEAARNDARLAAGAVGAERHTLPVYQQGLRAQEQGDRALAGNAFTQARTHFEQAATLFRRAATAALPEPPAEEPPAEEPPAEEPDDGPSAEARARDAMGALARRVERHFEAEDLASLRALSPFFANWGGFFDIAEAVETTATTSALSVGGDEARFVMTIQLTYRDNKNRRQTTTLAQRWTLEDASGTWRVRSVEASD